MLLNMFSDDMLTNLFITLICSFKSLTVAKLLPRILRTISTNISNVRPVASMSGFSNITSDISESINTSTSAPCIIPATCGVSKHLLNSNCVMGASGLYPTCAIATRRSVAILVTIIPSFSAAAITPTTSTKTPTSMYITVTLANIMNTINIGQYNQFSSLTPFTNGEASGKMPSRSNVFMASGTLSKYLSPTAFPSVICLKTMANM
mmetsp:Transcript_80641/g.127025  ORF Transcript_80641/g.127025 Transcript_80641/m.127025 type:complete len:207 (-) Transcript_80641:1475-2095(-)